MSQNVDGRTRVALVTGASRGIGRAIAERLATDGYDLVLVARDETALASVGRAVEVAGRRAATLAIDLANPEAPGAVAAEVRRVTSAAGPLDVLVNNAGVAPGGPFDHVTINEWDRTMALNARAPFFLTQALLPMLRAASPGYVVNIGSVVSRTGYALQTLYTASKHALLGFTKALAREVPTSELRVHAVLPGGVDTEMIRGVRPDISPDELISPEEVAEVVAQLLAMRGNAVIDEVAIRRREKPAWG